MKSVNKKNIFTPIKIGNIEIRNRIVMSPMGLFGLVTEQGGFTKRARDFYIERAKGGVGLIVTGLAKVENKIEKFKPGLLPSTDCNPEHFITSTSELTENVHSFNTKIFLQLGIGFGRVASPKKLLNPPVAPSPIPNYWDPNIICRELTIKEIKYLINKAGEAANIAKEAGFDGVEIHAVHEGYLLDQFAIGMFNNRNDEYGGDLNKRLKLAIDILKEVKNQTGEQFPVQIRFSVKSFIKDWRQGGLPGEYFTEKGRDLKEGLEVAKILEEAGYDSLNVDAGSYDAWYWSHPPNYQKHGFLIDLIEKVKDVVNIPVIASGRMDFPELAVKTIAERNIDMVGIGRGLLADAQWVNKVMQNCYEDIRPCLGCNEGCMWRGYNNKPLSCAINPACGREAEYSKVGYIGKEKKIIVAGGGIAGMEAARVAAERGYNVTIYEKNSELGGNLIAAAVPDFKDDIKNLLSWYKRQLKKLNVNINLNNLLNLEDLKNINFDALIVTTGSIPILPKIIGVNNKNVYSAPYILLDKSLTAESFLIIGGGLVGCETALWLAQKGKKVKIVEIEENIMSVGIEVPHMNRQMLIGLLEKNNVDIITGTSIQKIEGNNVKLYNKNGQVYWINGIDIFIMAVGFKSERTLYNYFVERSSNIFIVGDAKAPRNIMSAIWEAYEIAKNL